IAMCVAIASAGSGDEGKQAGKERDRYDVTHLTPDLQGIVPNTGAVLPKTWGGGFTPGARPFLHANTTPRCPTPHQRRVAGPPAHGRVLQAWPCAWKSAQVLLIEFRAWQATIISPS